MFKLQRLEITGFKSFADYTEIVFTGNGITAVVGPNGCGKSNVSDSIAWVLGEQRAKSLRGGEMKDVVFQGTKNRKPSGMAEVILHLVRDEDAFDADESELEDIDETLSDIDEHAVLIEDLDPTAELADAAVGELAGDETNGFHESEFEVETLKAAQVGSAQTVETRVRTKRHWRPRTFALDFAPGEAVSVTRRLYLSGESEYQLNGKTCRLRDIQDLFAGTGLSGSHYAIIEQGRIGQILSAKPGDRRNLIEEAAGISKFRTRQRAAESRLESAKTNLGRVSDIVSEIEKQASSLRRQAAKTRRYKILQDEFRVLLRQLFATEGRYLTNLVNELENDLVTAGESERSANARVAEYEEMVREATQRARAAEASLAEVRRQHSENALERDRAEREHRYQAEQVVAMNTRSEALRSEISDAERRLELARQEFEKLSADEVLERETAGKAELSLREAETSYKEKIGVVTAVEERLETIRTELFQHTAAGERFEEIVRQLEANLGKLSDRLEALNRERVRAAETYDERVAEAARLREDITSEHSKLERFQLEKREILDETAGAREALRAAEASQLAIAEDYSAKRHRLITLRELEEKRAVYVPQVQKLFERQHEIGVTLKGVLADLLSVDEPAEKAVESLFGNYLQAVLVENVADARKLSSWLNSNSIGKVAILAVPKAADTDRGHDLESDLIADHLGVPDDLKQILATVFPREMSARLVDALGEDNAGEGIAVSRSGEISYGGRMIVSGTAGGDEKNSSLLAFKRELRSLERSVAKLAVEAERSALAVEEANRDLAAKEERIVDVQSLIIKIERALHGLEIQETSARQEIERAARHRSVVIDELSQIETEIADIKLRRDDARKSAAAAAGSQEDSKAALEKVNIEVTDARRIAETENETLNERRTVAATSDERRKSAVSALRRVENEVKELDARLAVLHLELSELETKIKDLRTSIYQITDRLASAADDTASEELELAQAIDLLETERKKADKISDQLAESNHRAAEARNGRAEIEIRQAESITRLKHINEKCSEELGLQLAQLVDSEPIDEDTDLETVRAEAASLREKLENFGAINMLALEELGETEERLIFLTSQRQDIIDSIFAAEEALREIKERSREKFKRAFEAINENFMQYFQELFGGGRGEMTLLESDDVLEAGIEVVAQPPGKRLQNILLLSGGEKAMTAIALVLAIFKYRPSPFCLLDEVDAPLDDANVGRFVNKIAEMAEKTQFIVITHNKRTMEAARALYGVTMQEAGVSKVVSVKFE